MKAIARTALWNEMQEEKKTSVYNFRMFLLAAIKMQKH